MVIGTIAPPISNMAQVDGSGQQVALYPKVADQPAKPPWVSAELISATDPAFGMKLSIGPGTRVEAPPNEP